MRGDERGMTLLELLVVITIIVLLVALLLPAVAALRDFSKRQLARSEAAAIVHALKAYRQTYGRYPDQKQNLVDVTYKDGTGGTSLQGNLFMGIMGTDARFNARETPFIEPRPAGDHTCPVSGCWLDPWGGHYIVSVDENADGKTDMACGGLVTAVVGRSVAVASTNGWRPVYSWQ